MIRNLTRPQYVILAVLGKVTSQVIRNVFSITKICSHNNDKEKGKEKSKNKKGKRGKKRVLREEYKLDTVWDEAL